MSDTADPAVPQILRSGLRIMNLSNFHDGQAVADEMREPQNLRCAAPPLCIEQIPRFAPAGDEDEARR
ncbi:MAG TPA: hypothetical protein VHT91_13650 [Kofleriaceae bacterium]|jgi:hypothetical protein|nr:hypothetical protein [Kofleriaceae bacterium]